MKKPVIIVVILLAAALAALKFYSSKSEVPVTVAPAAGQAQPEQAGVALPEGATSYAASQMESVYVPTHTMGSYETLTLPPAALMLKGACEGGSPKEMMENHNKTWGYFTGRRISFDGKKSQALYDLMGEYYACLAAARQDITVCNELPGEAEKDGFKVTLGDSPMGYCRSKAGFFLFKAYIAGRAKEQTNCMGYLTDWDSANLARISPPEFCAAAAQGPEKISAYASARLPDIWPMAEKMLAFSKKVCGNDQSCMANNSLWEGIKGANPDRCPEAFKPHCSALAEKSQVPCVSILMDMSRKYCGYLKDLVKAGGGYAGMTAEEVKEDLRRVAEQKAEEERLRKEHEAITKDVNIRAKKSMGKQGE